MSQTTEQEFGKIRSMIWPIHNYELKKLIPMLVMAFFVSFNYTVLRDSKDALLVTNAGAEAIPFLKTIGTVPAAFLFMVIYSKMSNSLSRENLFYASLIPFIVFFGLFALFIYPMKESLVLSDAWAEGVQGWLPAGWSALVKSIQNWPYALFYIMAELWGSVALSLLFWGFANQITRVSESKRFYTLFGLGFNAALMVSGPMITYFSNVRSHLPAGVDPWGWSLNRLMSMVVIGGIIVLATYWWMNRNVLTDPRFYNPDDVKGKKRKLKMGIGESLKFILSSRYLLCLVVLVMGYGIAINLVEVTWKGQLKLQYPSENEYSAFMGNFSFWTGIVTFFMILFVGGNFIRKLGWKTSALATPTILVFTGLAFFGFIFFRDSLAGVVMALDTTPLMMTVIFGMVQNIMSKSAKYSLFDPTKEMAYIPLDDESKVKGKAAVDVVGARLGKSGGAFIQIILFTVIGGLSVVTPYIAAIVALIVTAWIFAVIALNKMFLAKSAERELEDQAEEESKKAEAAAGISNTAAAT